MFFSLLFPLPHPPQLNIWCFYRYRLEKKNEHTCLWLTCLYKHRCTNNFWKLGVGDKLQTNTVLWHSLEFFWSHQHSSLFLISLCIWRLNCLPVWAVKVYPRIRASKDILLSQYLNEYVSKLTEMQFGFAFRSSHYLSYLVCSAYDTFEEEKKRTAVSFLIHKKCLNLGYLHVYPVHLSWFRISSTCFQGIEHVAFMRCSCVIDQYHLIYFVIIILYIAGHQSSYVQKCF